MSRIRDALLGVWEFVAGDDWITALGVVLALVATALISDEGSAWWVLPVAVAGLLSASIWREARRNQQKTGGDSDDLPS